MKIFNIKVVKKRVFNILADTFPKLSTLLFNVYYNYSIVVTKIIQKMKSFTTLKMTQAFILNQSFLKVTQKCSSNIKAGTLKITYTFKSRIKESVNFVQNLSVNAIAKMRVKASLALTTTFDMVTDALVGKFRLLGELDPYYLVAQLKYNTFVNNGKTTQSGTGDPSPTNIRPIYGVGQFDKKVNTSDILASPEKTYGGKYRVYFSGLTDVLPTPAGQVGLIIADKCKTVPFTTLYGVGQPNEVCVAISIGGVISILVPDASSTSEALAWIEANPITVYYQSTAYATATQVYCGFSITDANGYHGYAAGPMAPLYDGDKMTWSGGSTVEVARNSGITSIDGEKIKFTVRGMYWNLPQHSSPMVAAVPYEKIMCSHFFRKFGVNRELEFCYIIESNMAGIFQTTDELNAFCVEQMANGTPVTLLYPLDTTTTETVPISEPIANTTGQTTIVVENTYTTTTTPINGLDDLTLGELDFQSTNI